MIKELSDNIKKYIFYLQNRGFYISLHTEFTEYMQSLLQFNIHENPVCLLIKSENDAWEKCINEHMNDIFTQKEKVKNRICYAGVNEYVFKLNCGGTVCVSTKKEFEDKNINEEMEIIIAPLLRMIEYLRWLCPEAETDVTRNEIVNRAVKFIQRNFYNPITNQSIAKACSCSESSLCHLFRKYMGISVHKYILELRLSYSKKLLKTSNLSITSIAYKSGFSDYNYFSYKFKKEEKITASEYRQKAK